MPLGFFNEATPPQEKATVTPIDDLYIDTGTPSPTRGTSSASASTASRPRSSTTGAAALTRPPDADLLSRYEAVDEAPLFENFVAFLEGIVPAAEEAGVDLTIHPDDPPWSIFGLPRIVTSRDGLRRLLDAVDHPRNGLTFCTGSLGARRESDLVAMAEELAGRTRARNVRHTTDRDFHEVAHQLPYGDVDLPRVLSALVDGGFAGPIRPDHGRMMWGETGAAGYGLYDRAIGVAYLRGVLDGLALRHDA